MKMQDFFTLLVSSKDIEVSCDAGINGTAYEAQEIAAAHAINCHDELVEALQGLMDWQVKNCNVWNHHTWDYASLVIKKARGEK